MCAFFFYAFSPTSKLPPFFLYTYMYDRLFAITSIQLSVSLYMCKKLDVCRNYILN